MIAVEITLTIPDNEAFTAFATLRRLGVEIGELRRAEVWCFELDGIEPDALTERVRTLETIFNPNKHVLRVRSTAQPEAGEVWIDEPGHGCLEKPVHLSGRELIGVRRAQRYTAWRLFTKDERPAPTEIVDRATDVLLCNPAFQKAMR